MKRLSERVAAFLAGSDGQRIVRRQLARHGFRHDVADDVVAGVLLRALERERQDPEFEPEVLEAFTARLVQRQTTDVLRGRLRRAARESVLAASEADGWWDEQADAAPGPDEQVEFEGVDLVVSADRVAGVRRRLAHALSSKPQPAAAALCVVTIFCDGAEPAEDCPRPKGGVAGSEAYWWAAVFYSGRTTCFPLDGAEEDGAMRQRRSRALRETRTLIEEAVRA